MNWKESVLEKIRLQEEKNNATVAAVPEKYRHYIMFMEKSSKINNNGSDLDKELTALGCYVNQGKAYLPLKSAYFTVMGKLAQFNDWVMENGYTSRISEAQFAQVGSIYSCRKTVIVFNAQGRMIKDASGTASVGFGGSGVDSTNPLENAETSALGRALTFLGMGTRVENIASAEEMTEAEKRGLELDKPSADIEKTGDTLIKELFLVEGIKTYDNNSDPIANLETCNKETGEPVKVWLKGDMAIKAKNCNLKKGDVIEAILAEIPGREGPVSTFLEFSMAS